MLEFLLRRHWRPALDALLLFVVGLFVSWPVVRYRLRALTWPPRAVFRFILRLMGRSPGIPRVGGVIFAYNATAIFIYMAAGFHPLVPKILGIWVGMNVGIVTLTMRQEGEAVEAFRPEPDQWRPPAVLSVPCGLVVLLLELPCFWFAIAMGISMGHRVQAGDASYFSALAMRAKVYLSLLVPALLVSGMAEAVAVRGSAAAAEETPPSGPDDQPRA